MRLGSKGKSTSIPSVVLLDETATATDMERRYGRAPQGKRCQIAVSHNHYKTTTVTAATRASGPFAVELMDGAKNGQRSMSYVTHTLVPALTPSDTVVMDYLLARKVAGVRKVIEAADAHLRCPSAYSPVGNAFANLKALLRSAAARAIPDLWTAIREAFTRFKPDGCRNSLAAAGYAAYDPT